MFGIIFALSLFLLGGVHAQDSTDDLFLCNGNYDDFTSIQTLIDDAEDGDTINLKNSTYFGNGNPISINKSITINGNDAQLDARSKSNIFIISKNSNVSLVGLTLVNGNSKEGGAIYNNGILNLEDCIFDSNSATFAGVLYNAKGLATITDSKFGSNRASDGAVIISKSNLVVMNCEFERNKISHSRGVIYNYAKATISDSTFRYNEGSDEGCCIFNIKSGNVNVTNSRFTDNSAISYAGAINNDGIMTIRDCLFDSNSAYGAGAVDNGGTLTIINSNFTRNSATINGGAIDTVGKMEAVNCIFDGNTAKAQGGAIIARGDINVSKSSFMDNVAGEADAIYINDDVEYSINDNWWNSDNPDFSELININLDDDFSWITHESKLHASNMTTFEGSSEKLEIGLVDGWDNPIGNAEISVVLDNSVYTLITDDNGQASMEINLMAGSYVADISYGGSDEVIGSSLKVTILVNKSQSDDSNKGDESDANQSGDVPEDNKQDFCKKYAKKLFAKNSISKVASEENASHSPLTEVLEEMGILDFIRFLIDLIRELIGLLFDKYL